MNINQALVVVSKPKQDSVAENTRWLSFLGKSKGFLSSNQNARRIAENSLLLVADASGIGFLRAITELKLHYELFLLWEMPKEWIQGFDLDYIGVS